MLKIFLDLISQFVARPAPGKPSGLTAIELAPMKKDDGLDWSNPATKISKYFTVHDACYLPSWKIHHIPSDQEKINIINTAKKMDEVKDLLKKDISVHVWIRPNKVNCPGDKNDLGDYNKAIGGASKSTHIDGLAVDFHCVGNSVDEIYDILEPKCMEMQFALENNGSIDRIKLKGGTGGPRNWVHLQIKPLLRSPLYRIFNP